MSFGSLLEYLKYFGPFLVKWDEYENDEKLLARFFLEVSSMSHTLFYESPILSFWYWSHSTFVAHYYHCIFARYFKCIGSKYESCLVSPTHGLYPNPTPHQPNFCLHVFFLQTHPSFLYRMTCFAFLDTLKPWVWHEIFYARKPLLIIILNAPKITLHMDES